MLEKGKILVKYTACGNDLHSQFSCTYHDRLFICGLRRLDTVFKKLSYSLFNTDIVFRLWRSFATVLSVPTIKVQKARIGLYLYKLVKCKK